MATATNDVFIGLLLGEGGGGAWGFLNLFKKVWGHLFKKDG